MIRASHEDHKTPARLTAGARRIATFVAVLALSGLHATAALAADTIRLVSALPTLSLITANQTSIPKELGYYAEEGLVVETAAAGSGGPSAAVQLVASGQQDVGSGSQSPMILRAAEGQDMGLIFFYNQIRDFHYVIGVLPESDITEVRQLKDKTVGVSTLASEAIVTARYVAKTAGLAPEKDINFVAIGLGAQSLHAIRTGRVHAISNLHASFTQMEVLGQKFRYLPNPPGTKDVFGPGFFVKRDYFAANKKKLVGLSRAIAKSTIFLISNPEAAIRIHWKHFPEQKPKGISDDEAIKQALTILETQMEGYNFGPNEPKLWGNYQPESWDAYLNIYGLSAKLPDPTRFYTNELIPEINNFEAAKIVEQAKGYRIR